MPQHGVGIVCYAPHRFLTAKLHYFSLIHNFSVIFLAFVRLRTTKYYIHETLMPCNARAGI